MYLRLIMILFLFMLAACESTYKPTEQILPQHIRKIAIHQFANATSTYGLEDKLTNRVIDEFVKDGRFTITKEEECDGVLEGEITHYILQPFHYGANFEPDQYKLWILVSIKFVDKVKNEKLWEEPNFEGMNIYLASTLQGGTTEGEARETIWRDLAQKILVRTVEGFGSAAGISEKKVPSSIPSTTAPSMPATP